VQIPNYRLAHNKVTYRIEDSQLCRRHSKVSEITKVSKSVNRCPTVFFHFSKT